MGWGMVFWALILAGLGYLLWLSLRQRRPSYNQRDPLEIAKIRLAEGEISSEDPTLPGATRRLAVSRW